jgi:hypothetical protein
LGGRSVEGSDVITEHTDWSTPFNTHKAYYGDENSGLVILANPQGTIDAVKLN